ncbi:MAG: glycerophosphodiester phosphodiesterase, partial [Lachnospiraceae bacterium]|nr:glycerophosphodiester phosphodiesterase [Lachnospiraceae bacterium]
IMPRLSKQGERSKFSKVYYAHRGLHDNKGEAPENSMEAFRKAAKCGYGIEMDVRLTKDMVPVVFHDKNLTRMCGRPELVSDLTYAQLKDITLAESTETIPLFEEVLKMVKGRVPLIIEYKVDWMDISICPIVDKMLREYKGLYCIESFNPMVLMWYRRYHNEIFRGQLASGNMELEGKKGFLSFILQNLLFNGLTKPDFVAYEYKFANNLSRNICRKLFRNTAVAWTIQNQKDMDDAKTKYDMFIFDSFRPKKMQNTKK